MANAIRMRGLQEIRRDFGRLNKKLQREFNRELAKLAGPAAEEIKSEAASHNFSARSIAGIRPGTRRGGAVVRQGNRKTTGNRKDFGRIQMAYAFLPGAERAEPGVLEGVEDWLDRITSETGLGGGGAFL